MVAIEKIITDNIDIWSSAIQTRSGVGRGSSKKLNLYGIKKLRELILELAVRGLLVKQCSDDKEFSISLERITAEKEKLTKDKIIKKSKTLPGINEKEIPFEIPNSWGWLRLGDVTNYGSSDKAEARFTNDDTWVLELEDVEKDSSKLLKKIRFSDRKFKSSKNKFFKGDVIYGKLRPYLDKVLVADEDGVCTTEMIPFRSYAVINSNFLRLIMKSPYFKSYANNSTHGMNLPRMGTDKARLALIPIVPETEQLYIVAKVDELMTLCDQLEQQQENSINAHKILVETLLSALTNAADKGDFNQAWERIAEHFATLFTTEHSIDQLKQTILQSAVMGKLVPQDPNDEPASVLLEKIAVEKERLVKEKKIKKQKVLPGISYDDNPFKLPNGWEWCRVWDVAELITSGSRDWSKYYSEDGVKFVTMGNLSRGNYKLRLNAMRYVTPPKSGEGLRTSLNEYDLLISITGDVGNLGLIPTGFGEAYINQHTCLLRFMPKCRNRYFPELMRSPYAKYQFDAPQRGIKNSFRLSDVGEMIIPVPPLNEQTRIVSKIDELMTLCEQLKDRIICASTIQLHLADAMSDQAIN